MIKIQSNIILDRLNNIGHVIVIFVHFILLWSMRSAQYLSSHTQSKLKKNNETQNNFAEVKQCFQQKQFNLAHINFR